uniref:Transposase (Putative), gypsy type n=1 Tax=Tanacetum cinerariifolium TaxID=118510 RepID=A0A699HJ51_TANCI|nr:transposase (putative), gypsy type [Tanacetum cinerariifolium]
MGTIDDMKSILTQPALDALCEKYHIPHTVNPELPGRNQRICNSPIGKIGVYTRFFDFANYRIPLSHFLVDILEYFQINLSQLSVIMAAKVAHFEILYRVHGFVLTVGNFRRVGVLCLRPVICFPVIVPNCPLLLVYKEMGLFDFINHAEPTKIGGVHVLNEEGAADGQENPIDVGIVPYHPKKLRDDHGNSAAGASIGEKFVVALQSLLEGSTLAMEVRVVAASTVPFVTSLVTLSPECGGGDHTDSVYGLNLRTQHPVERSFMAPPLLMIATIDSTTVTSTTSALVLRVGTELVHRSLFADSPVQERNVALEVDKGTLEGQVTAFESAAAAKYNKHASLTAQSQKDSLIDQVSSLETTCSGLRDQVSGYELFKAQYEAVQDEQVKVLSDKVAGLDTELMRMALHLDEEFYPWFLSTIAGRRAVGHAIDKGMQDGLVTGIDHGKAGRGLVDVAAYNPSAKANYVFAVNALHAMGFPLLVQLESQKDASIADIMGLLHLEGHATETPKTSQFQPSPKQLMFPIHRTEDQVVIGESSLSFSLNVVHARIQRIRRDVVSHRLSISNAMVPLIEPLFAENLVGEASTSGVPQLLLLLLPCQLCLFRSAPFRPYQRHTEPQFEAFSSPNIIFEQETLETLPEHPTT